MYEALGEFKFIWFGFLMDVRMEDIDTDAAYNLTEAFGDFAFKIMLSEDETALREFSKIKTTFETQDGIHYRIVSKYPTPLTFRDRDEALRQYEELNIILTYQDKIPFSMWPKEKT